jgi:hypothetical protein
MNDQETPHRHERTDSSSAEGRRKPFTPPQLERHDRLDRLTSEVTFGGLTSGLYFMRMVGPNGATQVRSAAIVR